MGPFPEHVPWLWEAGQAGQEAVSAVMSGSPAAGLAQAGLNANFGLPDASGEMSTHRPRELAS
jgi:hypothetical protein